MHELTAELNILSKEFQKQDNFPFSAKQSAEKTKSRLQSILKDLKNQRAPFSTPSTEPTVVPITTAVSQEVVEPEVGSEPPAAVEQTAAVEPLAACDPPAAPNLQTQSATYVATGIEIHIRTNILEHDISPLPDRKPWKHFEETVKEISNDCTYRGQALLIEGQQGISSRRHEDSSPKEIVKSCFQEFITYLSTLLQNMSKRFIWPKWLLLCEDCFDFPNNLSLEKREASFAELLEIQLSPFTLDSSDKKRLKEEYKTLCMIAMGELAKTRMNAEALLYKIFTEENLYRHCKKVISYALRPLSITFNECVVESLFSQILNTDEAGKPFLVETVDNICFIKANGPSPLLAKPLVRSALDEHFSSTTTKKWHFTTNSQKYFTSASVKTEMEKAKQKFSLFD